MIKTKLETLLIGTPQPFGEDGEKSAIAKQPVTSRLRLERLGLSGNQVADQKHHGGLDKAIHLYPLEHYPFWRDRYPGTAVLASPGAFGENLSCRGMTEDKLCLGDVFQIGTAVIECSHARQPCWKLNHRLGYKDVMKTVIQTGHSGSYFRVLQPGEIAAGDALVQIDRPYPEWPLHRLFAILIGGQHKGQSRALDALTELPALASTWRDRAAKLAAGQRG